VPIASQNVVGPFDHPPIIPDCQDRFSFSRPKILLALVYHMAVFPHTLFHHVIALLAKSKLDVIEEP